MKFVKVKIAAFLIAAVFLLFFSNDFGLIDVEKTAIITAVAIDLEQDGAYKVTAQIAVPEATDTNTENERAQISGKGATVGAAIKNIGDTSGWYPQLSFCNLIVIGKSFADYNVIKVIDYFSRTLRIQDSALIVMAEKDGEQLLKLSSPLDNISSFALQKIIIKNAGLNRDVAICDVKSFCEGYYSDAASAYMPIIKVVSQKSENEKASADDVGGGSSGSESSSGAQSSGGAGGGSGSGGSPEQTGGAKGDAVFNANSTALFVKGKKAGELDERLTLAFNAINGDFSFTTIEVNDVETAGEKTDYLLTVFSAKAKRETEVSESGIKLKITLDVYAKISDVNDKYSDVDYVKNLPMPFSVREKAEKDFTERLKDLVDTEIRTGCDFLNIKKELYRKHNSFYATYKDNFLDYLSYDIKVAFSGQK
ncbi:MAG: hypothetical protein IJU83_03180 [Clostridia bacterium]|nr:hypothetical protein [Clostridia bacterium]